VPLGGRGGAGGQEEPGAKRVVQENGENIPERTELHLESSGPSDVQQYILF